MKVCAYSILAQRENFFINSGLIGLSYLDGAQYVAGFDIVDTMGIDTMWVRLKRVDHTDTLLINRLCGAKATNFQIPISYTQPEDSICTTVVDTIGTVWRDTIVIKKDNMPHFESVDCQASYFHTLTAVKSTHYLIDTVVINHSFVSYDTSNEHLLLYLKARR